MTELNFKFLPVENFDGYYACSDGFIYSCWTVGVGAKIIYDKRLKKLSCSINKGTGYKHVVLVKNRKHYSKDVHVLIAETFHGKRPKGLTVSHKDGNKLNNKPRNLIYETHSDNHNRKKLHGTDDRGYKNSRALINKIQLEKIRTLIKKRKFTHKQIGEKFGLSRVFITKIKNGNRYNL